jgi:hypothetical protein
MNEVTHIAKLVKYSQFFSSTLKDQSSGKKCAIQLPCKTRWMSMFDCVDSLLLSKNALKFVVATNEDSRIDKDTCQTLLSDKFWTSVVNIHSILLPLKISLKFLEENSATISSLPEIFVYLQQQWSSDSMLLELLNRRRNFMLTGVHLAANLLDPVLKGGHLRRAEN